MYVYELYKSEDVLKLENVAKNVGQLNTDSVVGGDLLSPVWLFLAKVRRMVFQLLFLSCYFLFNLVCNNSGLFTVGVSFSYGDSHVRKTL